MKLYVATLTQPGETAPEASIGFNSLDGEPAFTVFDIGIFNCILAGAFPGGGRTKVYIDPSKNGDTAHGFQVAAKRVNDNLIRIYSGSPNYENGILLNQSFEIAVYDS